MGRPRIEITETMIAEAERLAGLGLTKEQVAISLGIHRDTLRKKESEYIGLSGAIKKGRAAAICEVANALYESALAGNVTSMIFWLKNMAPESWGDHPLPAIDEDSTPQKIEIVVVDGRRKDKDGNPVKHELGKQLKKEAA